MHTRISAGILGLAVTLGLAGAGAAGEPAGPTSVLPPGPASVAPPASMAEASGEEVGRTCQPSDGAVAGTVIANHPALANLQERLRAELEAGGEPAVVLNNKGYGYHSQRRSPAEVLRTIEREAAAQR